MLMESAVVGRTAGRLEPSSPGFSLTEHQGKLGLSATFLFLIIPLLGTISTQAAMDGHFSTVTTDQDPNKSQAMMGTSGGSQLVGRSLEDHGGVISARRRFGGT